jgi:DNA-binding NarL/FixJ family response regulator
MADGVEPVGLLACPRLSPREWQVLGHIVNGTSTKMIGRLLDLSPRTVEVHRQRVLRKTGARNAAHVAALAGRHGWVADIAPPKRARPPDV